MWAKDSTKEDRTDNNQLDLVRGHWRYCLSDMAYSCQLLASFATSSVHRAMHRAIVGVRRITHLPILSADGTEEVAQVWLPVLPPWKRVGGVDRGHGQSRLAEGSFSNDVGELDRRGGDCEHPCSLA